MPSTRGKLTPGGIALARKQFGVVESEGFDLDQDPPWTRLWTGHTADLQHLRWSGMLKDNGSHEKPPLFNRHLFSSFVERFIARGGVILHATTSLLSNASLQAGMAQLRVNDVDKLAFHRQLGITGVAQAMGWTCFSMPAVCASRGKSVWTELASKECTQLDRLTQQQASFASWTAGSETILLRCIIHRLLVVPLQGGGFSHVYGNALRNPLFIKGPYEISLRCSERWTQQVLPVTGRTFMTQPTAHYLVVSPQNRA